jgi:hypothetical protein
MNNESFDWFIGVAMCLFCIARNVLVFIRDQPVAVKEEL